MIVRTSCIGSWQWHEGEAGRSFFMKFIQVRASIYFLKGRSSDRESTNKLMNYAFCVGVDVEIPELKCKTI